ncbi:hypothetical protein [Pelagicoccus sp. SDUM812005]|uniref:hypothetical protein n=1 Tax=Pelagicoccus sp. SDUM812005 TaxID=3041257 RepID=UPI00280CCFCA|nr:hypothetical protein [Pelagicoccus sp. SDUM812005]MDQ8183573.1 hypothetical protein [Pelagicoccus sp. SDUM812005]
MSLLAGEDLEVQFKEASWFVDELGTAFVFLESEEEPVLELPDASEEVRFYSSQVIELKDDERGSHLAVIEFVPRRVGIRTFPSLRFQVGESVWKTRPKQFQASETVTSDRMELAVDVQRRQVYAGEPLRIDFVWKSDLPVSRLRAFRLVPSFFSDPSVKVFVPRSQVPPEAQFGLPVGGRRVIAHRIQNQGESEGSLGEVRFSIWVRFEAAGRYEIPEMELACSLLEEGGYGAHQYASYFNNSLFEPVDRSKAYQKLRATSGALSLEVLPLPESGRKESFSGLFSPESIEVSVSPTELELGQLFDIEVFVRSEVCSEMLEMSPLTLQRNLRHRFWVAEEMGERWQADGRLFTVRGRPLVGSLAYFPSLTFQVFDIENGEYRTIETASIPMEVQAKDGETHFPLTGLPGAMRPVEKSAAGIWHNEKGNTMSDLTHVVVSVLADGFWFFLLLGPLLFFVLRPWVRERRRRLVDALYGKRRAAVLAFRARVSQEGPTALRRLIAECFERSGPALTASEMGELLRKAGCERELVEEAVTLLRTPEDLMYSKQSKSGAVAEASGERSRAVGERIYRSLVRVAGVGLLLVGLGMGPQLDAADWSEAEAVFEAALQKAGSGAASSEIEAAFVEAALAFESCAREGIRPGASWYNSGNAWFEAGEIGRSIVAYRKARAFQPWDERIEQALASARALRLDELSAETDTRWPTRWILAFLSVLWLASWALLLCWQRYRVRGVFMMAALGLALSGGLALGELRHRYGGEDEAVLIAAEAYGRKGPSYAYQSAFNGPLHSGLELRVKEVRGDWLRVSFGAGEECWLPRASVETL